MLRPDACVLDMQRTKREKEFERETRRERREKEQLLSRKKHKRAKNGKRGKREKKTKVKELTERKFSLLLCFFFRARELFFLSSLISALSDALLKKEQTL